MLIKQTTQMTDSERIATENSNNQFLQSLSFVAVGTIYPFAGSTIPDTFMLCDGSALDTTEYSELFSVIGYTYGGSGDSFNIPDLRGKVLVGCDSSDTSFNALGKKGGAKEVTLTVAQMPEHEGHLYQNVTDIEAGPPPIGNLAGYLEKSIMTAHSSSRRGWNSVAGNEVVPAGVSRGGDQPHENMPPYMVCNYIIKVNQGISTDDFRLPIDQTYTPTSPNAQSGLATAEAVGVANDYTDKSTANLKSDIYNNFAPAIKNNVTGEHIAINDVSSIEHNLQIKLLSDTITDFSAVNVSRCGKNIFDFESFANEIISYPNSQCEIVEFDGRRCLKITDTKNVISRNLSKFKAFGIRFNYYNAGTYTKSFFSFKNIGGAMAYIGGSTLNEWATVSYYYPYADKQIVDFRCYCSSDEENPIYIDLDSFMIEESQAPTDYEPYNGQTATANADGSVDGLTSLSPNMTVVTDTDGVTIDMTYNADTKMYIDNKIAEISAAIVNNS